MTTCTSYICMKMYDVLIKVLRKCYGLVLSQVLLISNCMKNVVMLSIYNDNVKSRKQRASDLANSNILFFITISTFSMKKLPHIDIV